jgi:molybdate transport system substrate-binding protein
MSKRTTIQVLLAGLCLALCGLGTASSVRAAEEAQPERSGGNPEKRQWRDAGQPERDRNAPILVFDAASLTDVVEDLGRAFTGKSHIPVRSSPGASSALARQIEAGAAADVFFSADLEWMDYLEQRKLLRPGSRHDVVRNRLVLIAPTDSKVSVKIAPGFDLLRVLGDGKLATGDPDAVPVGKYAHAALEKLGAWNSVAPRIVRAENVRLALAFVARGEAPLGIVYRTDALADKRVRIVDEFPEDSHPPIIYPMALTMRAGPAAQRFLEFVTSDAAKPIFRKYGFQPAH